MNDPSKWSPFHDKRGVPVCAGDLIKGFHFTGARRKRHYLYHVAIYENGHWMMVPTCHLDPARATKFGDGKCHMRQHYLDDGEVIHGHGPGDILDYTDRPRVKPAATESEESTDGD